MTLNADQLELSLGIVAIGEALRGKSFSVLMILAALALPA